MELRRLGKTELMVSAVGFGGIPIQRVDKHITKEVITECLKNNINFIDTARMYTVSEEYLGYALEGIRDKFIIATKSAVATYDEMAKDIDISLKNLKTDFIEIYQMHFIKNIDDYNNRINGGAYEALLQAQKDGKIGHIGITSHSADDLSEILKKDHKMFATIQFPYNPVELQGVKMFEKSYNEYDLGIIIMKPIMGGACEQGERSIKFILNNKHITSAIPGMESAELVRKNAACGIDYKLTKEDEEYISKLRDELGENFCRRCGYCMPCPVEINIPAQFLMHGYLTRYKLNDWAKDRYSSIGTRADKCVECGKCESKCPYNLPIINMLKDVSEVFK